MRRNKKLDLFERVIRSHTFLRAENATQWHLRMAFGELDFIANEMRKDLKK